MDEATVAPGDLIRQMFAAIDSQSWERLLDCFTQDAIYERPGYPALCGKSALLEFYCKTRIIGKGLHRIEHIVAGPADAACWGHFSGIARDGRALEERFADVYTLRDGRIAFRRTHFFRPAI